jgi:hypothetical protein
VPERVRFHKPAGFRCLSEISCSPFEYETARLHCKTQRLFQTLVFSRPYWTPLAIRVRHCRAPPSSQLDRLRLPLPREKIVHLSPSAVGASAICRYIPRRGSPDPHFHNLLLSSRFLLFSPKTSFICCQSASRAECSGFQRVQLSLTGRNKSCAYSWYVLPPCVPSYRQYTISKVLIIGMDDKC